jgi:hypothetical protein
MVRHPSFIPGLNQGKLMLNRAYRTSFATTLLASSFLQLCAQQPAHAASAAWPDPLIMASGRPVHSAEEFVSLRRLEILNLFAQDVFGLTPSAKLPSRVQIDATGSALGGLAVRKQITISFGLRDQVKVHLLLYLPAHAAKPAGVFVGLNFDGNQTVDADPGILLSPVWLRDPALAGVPLAKELAGHIRRTGAAGTRGSAAAQWQVRKILQHGFGLATVYAGDFDPDFIAGIGYGIRPLFFTPGQQLPEATSWGALGAWAWGMSRIVDYLQQDPGVDRRRIIAFGHSRLGKATLWAAAQDTRFAAVISNNSGQAGATLSHRKVGEPLDHLILAFPYWFCPNYAHYLGDVDALPVDGHLLLAAIAPRPLYIASGETDPYSDPEGEFLAARAVTPVYRLFGKEGVEQSAIPPLNHPVGGTVRYHIRTGGHDVTAYDWDQYLLFAGQL